MAGKNQVTLTFAGDHDKLTKSFGVVGKSAKSVATDVQHSSAKTSQGFDKAGRAADNTYDKFDGLEAVGRGTSDTMSGLADIMAGNVLQGSTDLAGGIAALASGFRDALLPGLKAAAAGMKAFTVSLLTNPIFLIAAGIAAFVAALVIAYKRVEWFRDLVDSAFGWVKDIIDGVGGAIAKVADWLGIGGEKSEEAAVKLDDLRKASEKAKAVQESFARATEKATGEVDSLIDSMFKLERGTLDLDKANENLFDAVDQATKAAKENGRTLQATTEKGRANQAALRDIAEATYDYVEAAAEQKVAAGEVASRIQHARDEFIRVAVAMGKSEDQARSLADQYGLIPRDIRSKVNIVGAKQAERDAARIREALNKIKNKIVRVDINQRVFRTGAGGHIPEFHEGGTVPGRTGQEVLALLKAGEHVLSLDKVRKLRGLAQRLLSAGFINEDFSFRGIKGEDIQNRRMLSKAFYGQGRDFNSGSQSQIRNWLKSFISDTSSMFSGGSSPTRTTPTVVIELKSSGNRTDDMLLEILRGAIRVKGGNVQVVLGQ